jgi:hypothetical protein
MRCVIYMGLAACVLAFAAPASAHDDNVRGTKRVRVNDNKDNDADRAVSTTRTTSFDVGGPNDPSVRRDVVESRAEERREVEGKRLTLAPMIGYGTNGLGLGVGGRLGYTFRTPVYLGANYMYHTGVDNTAYVHYPSGELGYDIGVGPVLLRPYAGLGAMFAGRRNDGVRDTLTTGVAYPGLTAHYLIPKSPAFVGADGRVLIPFEGSAALGVSGTAGLNF